MSHDYNLPFPSFNEYQDIGYAQTFEEAYDRIDNLYREEVEGVPHDNPPVVDFLLWRDLRVFDGKFSFHIIINTAGVVLLQQDNSAAS